MNIIHIEDYLSIYIKEVRKMDKDYKKYANLIKVLSDETRIKIVDMLAGGELCACNILEEFKITQPTLSYHMKTLCDSGLVNARRDGIWMKYSINKDVLDTIRILFDDIGGKISKGNAINDSEDCICNEIENKKCR